VEIQIHAGANEGLQWFNVLTTFLSVILGALLAYLATRISERRKERSERIAKATLFVLKFRNVVDGIFRLDRQIREGMERAVQAGVQGPPWTQFEEISAIGDYEEVITVEDMSVLAEGEHYDLIEGASELRDGHNGIVRALAQLYGMRNRLAEVIPPQQVQGNVAAFEGVLSPEAAMLFTTLTMLSENILRSLEELKQQARDVVPSIRTMLVETLRVKRFPTITLPPA
jgi:hypothetical protein